MSDQPENLMLVFLRRLDAKMDGLIDDVRDLKHRMTTVEQQLGGLAATESATMLAMRCGWIAWTCCWSASGAAGIDRPSHRWLIARYDGRPGVPDPTLPPSLP